MNNLFVIFPLQRAKFQAQDIGKSPVVVTAYTIHCTAENRTICVHFPNVKQR